MLIPLHDDNPTERLPWVTISLIALNVVVFAYELTLGPRLDHFIQEWALTPYSIIKFGPGPEYLTFLTSIFLHGGFVHIIGNMLYLWIFGNNIEDTLGHGKFIFFYLLCAVGASLAHIFTNPTSQIPALGASGAIAGILGAYLILFPRASIVTAIPIIYIIRIVRLPALIVIGFWFILQILSGWTSITAAPTELSTSIAWFAHIGGFITGAILIFVFPKRKKALRYRR